MKLDKLITKENGTFYLDVETAFIDEQYVDVVKMLTEGDRIRWEWEGQKFWGILQVVGNTYSGIFRLVNVEEI